MLAVVPERAHFNLTYQEVLELPVSLRDKMLEQLVEWRAQEDSKAKRPH